MLIISSLTFPSRSKYYHQYNLYLNAYRQSTRNDEFDEDKYK